MVIISWNMTGKIKNTYNRRIIFFIYSDVGMEVREDLVKDCLLEVATTLIIPLITTIMTQEMTKI